MIDVAVLESELRAACDAKDWELAATIAIRGYGPELLGYLNAMLRDPSAADDVFANACVQLWRGVETFAWHAMFRTWAYTITRNACISYLRGARTKETLLSTGGMARIAQELRTQTATFQRTETKSKLAELRAALDPDDQTLLILRVDRQLPWRDIAQVFEGDADEAALTRRAGALRKRFERLKHELREQLR